MTPHIKYKPVEGLTKRIEFDKADWRIIEGWKNKGYNVSDEIRYAIRLHAAAQRAGLDLAKIVAKLQSGEWQITKKGE